jgi:hypothetical protein
LISAFADVSSTRCGRSEISAAYVSATATIRAASGIIEPAKPSGYPVPSLIRGTSQVLADGMGDLNEHK